MNLQKRYLYYKIEYICPYFFRINEADFECFLYCLIPQEIQGAQLCHSSSTFQS